MRNLVQVQVSHDFVHVGKSVALVLARLGLPAEALITIKRKRPAGVATTAAAPLPGAIQIGACEGRTNSESPSCRKRVGERWGSKVDGSPVSSCSPSARRHPSGAADGAFAWPSLSQPQHQAPRSKTIPQVFGTTTGEPPFSDGFVGREQTARTGEAGRFDVISPVSPSETLFDGDVLVLSCPLPTMISFQGSLLSESVSGLETLGATAEQLQRVALSTKAASFLELVLSDCNHFVGRSPAGRDGALLANRYDCRIVAVRHTPTAAAVNETRKTEGENGSLNETASDRNTGDRYALSSPPGEGQGGDGLSSPSHGGRTQQSAVVSAAVHSASPGGPEDGAAAEEYSARGLEAAARPLAPGDVVLVLAKAGFLESWKDAAEFDLVTQVGAVPNAVTTYDYLSLLVFCGMLGWVLFSSVAMVSYRG